MRQVTILLFILFASSSSLSETLQPSLLVTYSKPLIRVIDDTPPLSVSIYQGGTAKIFVPHYMKSPGTHYIKLAKDEMLILSRAFENRKRLSTAVQERFSVENKLTTNSGRQSQVLANQRVHYSHPDYVDILYSDMPALTVDLNKVINFEQGQSSEDGETNTELNKVVVLLERVIRSRGQYEDL